MVTVDAIKKSQRNAHGGYNYASTDDIYAAVTRKMGEVGLIVMSLEERCEIKRIEKDNKTSQWAHMEFSFVLATEADTWTDPKARRTLYLQVTGAQTFQAAQSYAEKSFLRGLFKLPTGDVDLDSMPQGDTEEDQTTLSGKGGKRKSSAEAKRDGTTDTLNALRGAIAACVNDGDLRALYLDNCDDKGPWKGQPERWAALLEDDYRVRMDDLQAAAA